MRVFGLREGFTRSWKKGIDWSETRSLCRSQFRHPCEYMLLHVICDLSLFELDNREVIDATRLPSLVPVDLVAPIVCNDDVIEHDHVGRLPGHLVHVHASYYSLIRDDSETVARDQDRLGWHCDGNLVSAEPHNESRGHRDHTDHSPILRDKPTLLQYSQTVDGHSIAMVQAGDPGLQRSEGTESHLPIIVHTREGQRPTSEVDRLVRH